MPEQPSSIALPDFIVVLAYFVMVIFVGGYFRRSVRGAKGYFAAGNIMPWWLAGVSYFMVSFSTTLFLIYNEIAYNYGLVAFTITWVHGSTMLLVGVFLAHRWRRARVLTPLGFMERRYSASVHQLFVWAGFPLRMLDNALKIYGTAIIVTVAVRGIHFPGVADQHRFYVIILVLGAVFILYTLMGGQAAVIITDFVQAIILFISITTIFMLCIEPFDGWRDLLGRLPEGHSRWMHGWRAGPYDLPYIIMNTFILSVLNNAAGWAMVQKYNTVRSESDARKMVWLVTALKMISPPLFFLPGLAARHLMPDIVNTRFAFAEISFAMLPVGLMGLLLAAMFSAITSTLGAEYNTLSGILTRDFYKRRLRPGATPRQELRFGRWATLLIGGLTMLLGMLGHFVEELNLMDIMHRIFGAFGPPIFIPIFLGLLTRRFNSRGVWTGVIAGASVGLVLVVANFILADVYAEQMRTNPTVNYLLRGAFSSLIIVANCAAVLLGMWIGTLRSPRDADEERHVREFFADMERPFLIDADRKPTESPFRLIGMTTFWFGMVLVGVALLVLATGWGQRAFLLNLATALVMVFLGVIMWIAAGRQRGDMLGGTDEEDSAPEAGAG